MTTKSAERAKYEARRNQMLELWLAGDTLAQVGEKYGITWQAVQQIMLSVMTTELKTKHVKMLAFRRQQLIEMRESQLLLQLIELMNKNTTRTSIKQQMQISDEIYRRLIKQVDPRIVIWHKTKTLQRPTKYKMDDIMSVVREAAQLNGGSLSTTAYQRLRTTHPHWPSVGLLTIFGWNKVLESAGVPSIPQSPWLTPTYSHEDYRAAVLRVGRIYGRVFRAVEYTSKRLPNEPSAAAIRYRVGSYRWPDAIVALAPELSSM